MSEPAAPRHFPALSGRIYQLGPMTLAFKASEAEVNGAFSLIESIEPPGASVDLHRHLSWQETFVVLEGRFDFDVAGARHALGQGEILVVPRGATHGFSCTSLEAGRLLTISTPSHVFEAFVAEVSAANRDPSINLPSVFARHGVELLASRPGQAPSARDRLEMCP
jgi:quercetin dioxygenase-like cupin family protein